MTHGEGCHGKRTRAASADNLVEMARIYRAGIVRTALTHPSIILRNLVMAVLGAGRVCNSQSASVWMSLSIAAGGGRRSADPALNAYLRMGFSIIESVSDQYYMEIAIKPSTNTGKL